MFISVEGGEGVGKSSFIEALAAEIRKTLSKGTPTKGTQRKVLVTREPGGSPVGEKLRSLFNHPPEDDPLTPQGEFLLISASRAQHVAHKINPALERGEWVLSDRFFDSTFVYQGVLGGLAREFLDRVITFSTSGLKPDLTFLLDCDVDIALSRVKKRSAEGSLETRYDKARRQHHQTIRDAYLRLAKEFHERFVVLDASQRPDLVLHAAVRALSPKLAGENS